MNLQIVILVAERQTNKTDNNITTI